MKTKWFKTMMVAALVFLGVAAFSTNTMADGAYPNRVTYTGQGLYPTGTGGYGIGPEVCGIANGADVDGPYLLWVLTATGSAHADITINGVTYPMTKFGNGTFKYIGEYISPLGGLINTVYATYDGRAKNAQLTISHGCAPKNGAWCSPGYWKNTLNKTPNGWMTIGVDPTTATFNGYVSPLFYANDLAPDVLLTYVLNNPQTYGGQLGTADPYGLTAFNAVGAYLTSLIPGFTFDPTLIPPPDSNTDEACPIDAFGNFKP